MQVLANADRLLKAPKLKLTVNSKINISLLDQLIATTVSENIKAPASTWCRFGHMLVVSTSPASYQEDNRSLDPLERLERNLASVSVAVF